MGRSRASIRTVQRPISAHRSELMGALIVTVGFLAAFVLGELT